MTTAQQQSVIDPFQLLSTYNTYQGGGIHAYDDYCRIVEDQFLNYYVGISDLHCEGKFKEKKLMGKIEYHLVRKGKIAALEVAGEILLADIVGSPEISLLNGRLYIIKLELSIIGDSRTFAITRAEPKDPKDKTKERKLTVLGEETLKNSIDPNKIVVFYNNETGSKDLQRIDFWLSRAYFFLDQILYDADKCRKKIVMFSRQKLAGKDWKYFIEGYNNNDIIANIALDESQKSKGKKLGIDPAEVKHFIYGPESKEREQLWRDYHRTIAEMCKYNGLRYNIGWKEERQNIPEIGLIEAPFKAWETERKNVREEALQQCEKLGWIEKGWELVYGAQAETNEQKINKLEQEIRIIELKKQLAELKNKEENKENNNVFQPEFKQKEVIYEKR